MRRALSWILHGLLLVLFLGWTLLPVWWMISSAFKLQVQMFEMPPRWWFPPRLDNFVALVQRPGFWRYFTNSVVAAGTSTLVSLGLGVLAGYGLSRGRGRYRRHMAFWMITTRMAPIVAVLLPLYMIFRRLGLVGSLWSVVVAYVTFNLPFAVWLMKSYFDELPVEVEEAALIDGASRLGVFRYVALPLARPGVLTTATLAFMFAWNDYEFAVVFTTGDSQTVPIVIARLITQHGVFWGQVMANGTLLLIPILVLGLMARRHLVRGLSMGAVSGK